MRQFTGTDRFSPQRDLPHLLLPLLFACLLLGAAPPSRAADAANNPVPQWIWGADQRQAGQAFRLQKEFEVGRKVLRAKLRGVADYSHANVWLNQTRIATQAPFGPLFERDVADELHGGANTLAVDVHGLAGPAAVFLSLEIEFRDGSRRVIVSDATWRATFLPGQTAQSGATFAAATFGAVAKHPWLAEKISVNSADDYTQWKRALEPGHESDAHGFELLPGFKASLVRSARKEEDSWVSLACDTKGRWIVAKEKRGLLRITPPGSEGGDAKVETINESLAECRGLLFAHDSLYAMANVDKSLYRLRDTNGDDQFDDVQKLATFEGGAGHGRNQIALGPDGRIYCIMGDSVEEPEAAAKIPPALANENRFEKDQSGFVIRIDADGQNAEVVVRGLRNPFGIDFNTDGEMFTYDADAEYDMGASWYRPTRIDHLVIGADFGWRRVTKQWPPYFPDRPDMPRPTLDIGKGSPTAVVFGTKSDFPPLYRNALFALDWTYGRIMAIHMTPRGSSYQASAETFLRGQPLNVTDADFGPDGAMYFVTGGRGTQSALYRVEYVGPPQDAPAQTRQQADNEAFARASRQTRKELESLINRDNANAIERAWPLLGHADPWIRHAARVVIESHDISLWRSRAIKADPNEAGLAALLALFRSGSLEDRALIVDRLNSFDLAKLPPSDRLTAVFLYRRCLSDDSPVTDKKHSTAISRLAAIYPNGVYEIDRELSRVLAQAETTSFVDKTVALLNEAANPNARFHYLFVLRNTTFGWTDELRESFAFSLRQMNELIGGDGMPTFRQLIQSEAVAAVSEKRRVRFEKRLSATHAEPWRDELVDEQRQLVKEWTTGDFNIAAKLLASGRDFKQGRQAFLSSHCIVCHRIRREGGVTGPDLTSVAGRFTAGDLLKSILEPSAVIAEKYQNELFELKDGRVLAGRVAPGDYRSPEIRITPDLLDVGKAITFLKREIEFRKLSPVSPMPKGLVNNYTKQEILDLLAFVLAAGNPNHRAFRP